jgi:hypothetical protein
VRVEVKLAKEAIDKLTPVKLKKIIDVIERDGFITDEHDERLVSKGMIKYGAEYLFKRLEEVGCEYSLDYTAKFYPEWGEVAAIFDSDKYEDSTEFKKKALDPFVQSVINKFHSL